jgi:hypothetical protein
MQKRSRSKDMSAPKDVIPYILAECAVATITGDCVITYWSIIGKRVCRCVSRDSDSTVVVYLR